MTTRDWDTLPTETKKVQLQEWTPVELAKKYARPKEVFEHLSSFFASVPKQSGEPAKVTHNPPKDLIVSARRDLSFIEANFELIDNSIDEWRRRGATKDLHITIDYDLDLSTGLYQDDAGGMGPEDVFRVFIPGETSNKDVQKSVIGSFGMGAKKGIFRLTDGAKVVSSPNGKVSYTSEVPEKWELEKDWRTQDGTAEPIQAETTRLYFFKLVLPPSQDEIVELRRRAGIWYAPLMTGELGVLAGEPKKKIEITINKVKVTSGADIVWACPEGGEPRTYVFEHRFPNTMGGTDPIPIQFVLRCGILTKLPAGDTESGFGIDVYGNGRMIERHLQKKVGFGISGLKMASSNVKFVRGKLFINGHSGSIPWDTHKREFLDDHPVSEWLRHQLRPIYKAFAAVARPFTEAGTIEARGELAEKPFVPSAALPVIKIQPGKPLATADLPKLKGPVKSDPPKEGKKTNGKPPPPPEDEEDDEGSGSGAEVAEAEPENEIVALEFTPSEFSELCSRFQVTKSEELQQVIQGCLLSGIAFTLEPDKLAAALKKFKCKEGIGELSDKIRQQLLKSL